MSYDVGNLDISNPHYCPSSHVKFPNETKMKQNVDDHPSNNSVKLGFNGSTSLSDIV